MAFKPFGPGNGVDMAEVTEAIMANSKTFAVGDLVFTDTTTGFITNGSMAGAAVLGIIIGFVEPNDTPIPPTAYVAGTATTTNVSSVTTASDNQTVGKLKALVCTSRNLKYSAQVNGTIGTTVHSDVMGCGIDVDSANSHYDRVLETTASRTRSTITNFYSWGVDPADSTRLIVSISASEAQGKY